MKRNHASGIPRAAQWLLSLMAGHEHHEAILGDLQEEFEAADGHTDTARRRWYWREALRAVPGLMRLRLSSAGLQMAGWAVLLTLAGYLFLILWSSQIAGAILPHLFGLFPQAGETNLFMAVRMLGMFVAALAISGLAFSHRRNLRWNFLIYLFPLLMTITLPRLYAMALADYDIAMGLLTLCLDGAAILFGAAIGGGLKKYLFSD